MLKNFILFSILGLFTTFAYGQVGDCNCNKMFDQDIKTDYTSFDRATAKAFFYEYFSSNETQRKSMKKDRKNSFGLSAVVESIPTTLNSSSSNNSSSNTAYSISLEALKQGYVSDEQLNILVTSFVPPLAFSSYNACLELCGKYILNQAGVKMSVVEENEDIVILRLEFKSIPSGQFVTISSTVYTNGEALRSPDGKISFYQGRKIKDNTITFETIRRIPNQDLFVTISFEEPGVGSGNRTFKSKSKGNAITSTPIGAIIPSLLPYETFMKINKFELTGDLENVIWVPCDGRDISKSTYSRLGGLNFTTAPDLRGLFLRGINEYNVLNSGLVDNSHLNPDNKRAGEYQGDAFQGHWHNVGGFFNNEDGANPKSNYIQATQNADGGNATETLISTKNVREPSIDGTNGNPRTANETRPVNMTVYYYIKIN